MKHSHGAYEIERKAAVVHVGRCAVRGCVPLPLQCGWNVRLLHRRQQPSARQGVRATAMMHMLKDAGNRLAGAMGGCRAVQPPVTCAAPSRTHIANRLLPHTRHHAHRVREQGDQAGPGRWPRLWWIGAPSAAAAGWPPIPNRLGVLPGCRAVAPLRSGLLPMLLQLQPFLLLWLLQAWLGRTLVRRRGWRCSGSRHRSRAVDCRPVGTVLLRESYALHCMQGRTRKTSNGVT